MIPTLFAIMILHFVIIQLAPGGPVEQTISEIKNMSTSATGRVTGGAGQAEVGGGAGRTGSSSTGQGPSGTYRGAQGPDPTMIGELERRYGFDKPLHVRFFTMLRNYARFDFGQSLFKGEPVIQLILKRM